MAEEWDGGFETEFEEDDVVVETVRDLSLELEFESKVSYVMYHNRMNVLNIATAVNRGDSLHDVVFRLSSCPSFFKPIESHYDVIQPGQTVFLTQDPFFKVILDPNHISEVTEKEVCTITLEAICDGDVISSTVNISEVLPFNYWPGIGVSETLACFVMPNAESMATMRSDTSDILASWTGKASLDGYQSENRDTVKKQAAAVYAAMEKRNMIYVNPPPNFENIGQRVRTPEEVLGNREGTCIDLAVTYASILESIGINPLLFVIKGHALVGFWLVDNYQNDIVNLDNAAITRHIRNKELLAVECTVLVSGSSVDFETACSIGARKLEDAERFICSIDIKRARMTISPLPVRKMVDGTWVVERQDVNPTKGDIAPVGEVYSDMTVRKLTKVDIWKRDLLDLTSRNNMVNMKLGTKVAPLLVSDVSTFEDLMSEGREMRIQSKPLDWDGADAYGNKPFEVENYIGNYSAGSLLDIAKGIVRLPMGDNESQRSMRAIYRLATKEIEESGCNSLFISLGVLRWYEGKSTGYPRYAPLILIPASLRKVRGGFAITRVDEDTVFNVTLLEKLRQEYDIEIPIEDPLPVDDKGVNVERILQIVRRHISDRDGWEVFSGAALGVFSFSQYAMWRDLDQNMDYLSQSDIVRCLVDGTVFSDDNVIDEVSEPYGLCLTVPADGSQIRAVRAASKGETFVMHGPPGTGKSQTITNIITNSLYEGKTVLFVAEKSEALAVVQKRLEEVGVGNHCLELHSNKAAKSKVLEHIRSSLERCQACEGSENLVKQIENIRSKLDAYAMDLHEPMGCGLSIYDCISRYESYGCDGLYDIVVDPSIIMEMSKDDIDNLEQTLQDIIRVYRFVMKYDTDEMRMMEVDVPASSLSYDARTAMEALVNASTDVISSEEAIRSMGVPFDVRDTARAGAFIRNFSDPDGSMMTEPDLRALVESVSNAVKVFSDLKEAIARMSSSAISPTESEANALRMAASNASFPMEQLIRRGMIPQGSILYEALSVVKDICSTYDRVWSHMALVSTYWNDNVYAIDRVYQLSTNWSETNKKGILSKGKARKDFMTRVAPALRDPSTKFEDLSLTSGTVSTISADVENMGRMMSRARSMEVMLMDAINNLDTIGRNASASIIALESYGYQSTGYKDAVSLCSRIVPAYSDLESKNLIWKERLEVFRACVRLSDSAPVSTPSECLRFCNSIGSDIGIISDWANWNNQTHVLESMGLADAVDLIASNTGSNTIISSICRAVYRVLIENRRQSCDSLRLFSASDFESLIAKFKRLDQNYIRLNRNLLKYTLHNRVPRDLQNSVNGSEAYTLYKSINTNTRKSIRKLISEVPNILPRICPCFLMSPQSVAQYLTLNYPKFDIVIFDESSQITTSKAIGSLGRAGTAVIAGDNRQLPPTTFFQKKVEPGEDEDEDLSDAESFLDDCLGLHLPETYLEWHYRSRHESLIAFSNMMFYGNKMLTFPSPNDQETRVVLRSVDGVYERGKRTNEIEARAIVEEVRQRVMAGAQSIGVIAFSSTQQECIEDMLDDLTNSDHSFAEAYNNTKEKTFIKNLETVQGDERDLIMFSIGYGPGADGTVFQNFGPINREGGGRRLNVAVSRARCEMVVFSSMRSTQVNITPSSSSGVRCLKEFLRFSENHGRFYGEQHTSIPDGVSSIIADIASNLQQHGYRTHYNVGKSGFRVDVAVVDPDNPEEYLLGILGDGDNYRRSSNTRDREYAREDVLRNLDWHIMHVWSMDWFFRKEEVIDRIVSELESIRRGESRQLDEESEDEGIGLIADEVEVLPPIISTSRRVRYIPPILPNVQINDVWEAITHPAYIRAIGAELISVESPINEEYLVRLYAKTIGIQRLTERNRNQLTFALSKVFSPTVKGRFKTYWKGGQPYPVEHYRVSDNPEDNRPIECIPLEELLLVCVETIRKSVSVSREVAINGMARELGYRRAGDVIRSLLEEVLDIALSNGTVVMKDNTLMLP